MPDQLTVIMKFSEGYCDSEAKFVDIAIKEDCLFWLRQIILQYGANACILKLLWLAEQIRDEYQKAYMKYETPS